MHQLRHNDGLSVGGDLVADGVAPCADPFGLCLALCLALGVLACLLCLRIVQHSQGVGLALVWYVQGLRLFHPRGRDAFGNLGKAQILEHDDDAQKLALHCAAAK